MSGPHGHWPPPQLQGWILPSAGPVSSLGSPRGSHLSVFPRLAEELETQNSGRCRAESGQATAEGRLAGAEA